MPVQTSISYSCEQEINKMKSITFNGTYGLDVFLSSRDISLLSKLVKM
nr:CPPV232 ankyrin repeat protein [Cooks petrelpox virus]